LVLRGEFHILLLQGGALLALGLGRTAHGSWLVCVERRRLWANVCGVGVADSFVAKQVCAGVVRRRQSLHDGGEEKRGGSGERRGRKIRRANRKPPGWRKATADEDHVICSSRRGLPTKAQKE
jgi:hypothetical protein